MSSSIGCPCRTIELNCLILWGEAEVATLGDISCDHLAGFADVVEVLSRVLPAPGAAAATMVDLYLGHLSFAAGDQLPRPLHGTRPGRRGRRLGGRDAAAGAEELAGPVGPGLAADHPAHHGQNQDGEQHQGAERWRPELGSGSDRA
jgi:hypothetical protein